MVTINKINIEREKHKMKASIIGFGNFGKLMAKQLSKRIDILVTDVLDKSKEAKEIGVKFVSLDDALKEKIIILSVPMENLVEILHKIKGKLKPGTLVLDVCSLKIFSANAMREILPKNIEVIATHPLFGPQSAPKSIAGMKIALCKVRAKNKTFNLVKKFCNSLKLKVIVTTPEKHDKEMAFSQALTHFIGQVAKRTNIKRVKLSTKTFDDLINIIETIKNDTSALFENIQTMNIFAKDMRKKFVNEAIALDSQLNNIQIDCKGVKSKNGKSRIRKTRFSC